MGKLLEKILSPIKTFVAAAIITAAVAGMPSEAQGKSQSKDFEYFTQSRNITTGHLVSPPEKGLSRSGRYGEIKSIGNYQESSRAPRNAENIEVEVGQEKNQLEIIYSCQPKRFNERLPVYEQMLREDSVNTHVYFLLPGHVTPLREVQMLKGVNNRTMNPAMHIATPFEDTKPCEAIKNINIATEEGAKPRDCDRQELERAYDNTADAIGGVTGAGMKGLKGITKWGMNRAEKKRIKKIRETYGEDYQIHKMPFHQIDGPVFKYTYFGRRATLTLDTSEVIEGDKAYIIIPQLSFTQDVAGTTRRATLENLAYEIPLEAQELEISKKYSLEESKEILNGKWNSLKGDKTITIDLKKDTKSCEGGDRNLYSCGTYTNNKGKKMISKFSLGGKYQEYWIWGYDPKSESPKEIFGYTIKILTPRIITGDYEYFTKEGTKIEKLNSLEELAGTWKVKESFLKTLSSKKQEGGKSTKVIINSRKILCVNNGGVEEEGNLDKGGFPALKINSVYFVPKGRFYLSAIIKINKNNLLLTEPDEDPIPFTRVSSSKEKTPTPIEFEVDENGYVRPKKN